MQNLAFVCGGIFLPLTGVGMFASPHEAFISYLFAYVYWVVLALGCLMLLMLHSLARGDWGMVTRRFYEAGTMTFPFLAVLFIPLIFGSRELYPWANPSMVAADSVLKQKSAYDNATAFLLRTIIFFAITIMISRWLRAWSLKQDTITEPWPTIKMRALSGPGIVIIFFAATFVLVDWVMSIERAWFSTIFPVILITGGVLGALALAVILLAWFEQHPPMSQVLMPKHFHDLGNMLLAFVMFWTYVAFSQLLVSYSGNQPHEIAWYLSRIGGGWKCLIFAIFLFYFLVPFLVLLSRSAKRNGRVLVWVAVLILVMNVSTMFWTVVPTFYPAGVQIHWTDITALLGIGGIWLGVFATCVARHPLLIYQLPKATSLEPVPYEK